MDPVITTFGSGWALLAILAIAVATRYGNALLTDASAPDWVTGSVAWVLAGAGALSTYLVDVKGVPDWKSAFAVFVGALVATKAVQAADPGIEPHLKASGGHIGRDRLAGFDRPPR